MLPSTLLWCLMAPDGIVICVSPDSGNVKELTNWGSAGGIWALNTKYKSGKKNGIGISI